jgi:dihydroorotase-like cyclic amidohydrolase
VTENGFHSRSANSWLIGRTLKSRVALTVANGAVVHE